MFFELLNNRILNPVYYNNIGNAGQKCTFSMEWAFKLPFVDTRVYSNLHLFYSNPATTERIVRNSERVFLVVYLPLFYAIKE